MLFWRPVETLTGVRDAAAARASGGVEASWHAGGERVSGVDAVVTGCGFCASPCDHHHS